MRIVLRRVPTPALFLSLFVASPAAAQFDSFLSPARSGAPGEIAQEYLAANRDRLGLTAQDLADVVVKDAYRTRHNGVTHIYLRQRIGGIEVLNGDININITRDGRVINVGNGFIADLGRRVGPLAPRLQPEDAIAAAARHVGLKPGEAPLLLENRGGPALVSVWEAGSLSREEIPVRLMIARPGGAGAPRLSWVVTLRTPDDLHWWVLAVDAVDGRVLEQIDWVASETSGACNDCYEVYALPKESPLDGPRTIEVGPADSGASPFGWHDTNGVAGAEFTDTRGNNVEAQTDLDANNSFGPPDVRASGGVDLFFSDPVNLDAGPETYREAAVTNLFYWNNILHDITYQYGFDEAAGNFQTNNYGRGGAAGDPVQADAQDGSGTNNANFATPPDGFDPRMQMFVWTPPFATVLTVNSPGGIAGDYLGSEAAFGPALPALGVTADLVLVEDGVGPDSNDGCTALTNGAAVNGNVALVNRGECSFVTKVRNAQTAGAVAVVIVNNKAGNPITLGDDGTGGDITIASGMISQSDGDTIKPELPGVNVTFAPADPGSLPPNRDSDLDAGIIAHEYGHGISNRLVGGPSNTGCLGVSEQMGEGWSDWWTLVLSAGPLDTATQARGIGNYSAFGTAGGPGIRNFPYSTDMTVNPLTYDDIKTTNLPHGLGEVWNSMLWEMYWLLVARDGFNGDLYSGPGGNRTAIQLVIDGMKLTNCRPTFTDARDAILLADAVNNGGENQCLIWEAFAKRGLGLSAEAGSPFSVADGTEAFDLPLACTAPGTLSLLASGSNCGFGGFIEFEVYGGTPNGLVVVGTSETLGDTPLTGGRCQAAVLGLESPTELIRFNLDGSGNFNSVREVPLSLCGDYLQVVDVTSCDVSNTAQVPAP